MTIKGISTANSSIETSVTIDITSTVQKRQRFCHEGNRGSPLILYTSWTQSFREIRIFLEIESLLWISIFGEIDALKTAKGSNRRADAEAADAVAAVGSICDVIGWNQTKMVS